ncbi:MAG TPA: HAMP domain-containing sensor histidine kinase [Fibrobacteria bacterium]|nr:HAMP domain-containing sensor histidine kinase [Fibrobacteria bacterium]
MRLKSSILVQLLVGGFAATTAVMAMGGAASYWMVKTSWIEQIDRSLESRALGIASACRMTENGLAFDAKLLDQDVFHDPRSLEYFEVRDSSGKTLGRSASLGTVYFPRQTPKVDSQVFGWFHPATLHRMRFVSKSIALPDTDRGNATISATIFFGQDFRDAKNRLRDVRWRFFWVWCAAEILLSSLLYLVVRTSLSPLGMIADRLREVSEDRPGRFGDLRVPVEVAPLVRALETTLGRLSEAFQRERTLLADLAHELRTPLSGLRTTLEVGVDDVEEEARSALRRSLSITVGMQSLMESLMVLARLDGKQIEPALVEVDLSATLEELWKPHAERAAKSGCSASLETGADSKVRVDADWMAIVVRNLLDNAVRHAGSEGWIDCRVKAQGDEVGLTVRNSGSRLVPAEIEKVFDRFWRLDSSRGVGAGHAGLGLSLCRELVVHMGGTIQATVPEPGVFQVDIRLPKA